MAESLVEMARKEEDAAEARGRAARLSRPAMAYSVVMRWLSVKRWCLIGFALVAIMTMQAVGLLVPKDFAASNTARQLREGFARTYAMLGDRFSGNGTEEDVAAAGERGGPEYELPPEEEASL